MKICCPHCNGSFELEAYLKDAVMIQVIKMLPEFGRYEISREGLAAALRMVCNQLGTGRPGGSPLQNHNYLKKCAIQIAEEEAGKKSREEERKRRAEEERLKLGDPQISQITQIQDLPGKVKDLLGRIGG